MKTPICLDESIHTVRIARDAIAAGACRIINIKPGRVGGHRESIRLHDLCAGASDSGLARRHAGDGHRPRAQHPSREPAELHAAGRHRRQQALLRARSDRAGDRGGRRWHHRRAGRSRASACTSCRSGSSAQRERRSPSIAPPVAAGMTQRGRSSRVRSPAALLLLFIGVRVGAATAARGATAPAADDLRREDGVDPAARGGPRPRAARASRPPAATAGAAAGPRTQRPGGRRCPTAAAEPGPDRTAERRRPADPASSGAGRRADAAGRRRRRRWRRWLADTDPEVRQMAAFAMGLLGDASVADALDRGAQRCRSVRAGTRGRRASA